jgi:hypothetical protein
MSQWSAPWNAPKPQAPAVVEPAPVVEATPAPTQTTPAPVVEAPAAEDTSAKKATKKVEPTQAE